MSAELEVQQAIFNVLKSDAPLVALLAESTLAGSPTEGAVYDYVPQPAENEDDTKFPYVGIGEYTAIDDDTDDVHGQEHTVTLHVYDRRPGSKRAKQVIGAIYDALHDKSLSVSGHSTVYCFWEFAGSVPDPDPMIRHEVTRFRIVTQEA